MHEERKTPEELIKKAAALALVFLAMREYDDADRCIAICHGAVDRARQDDQEAREHAH